MKKPKLIIGVDFREFFSKEYSIFHSRPAILKIENPYKKNKEKIKRELRIPSKLEIIKIIDISEEIGIHQIKKILGLAYSTIYEHLKNFEELGLINLKDSKSQKGKREVVAVLKEDIEVTQLMIWEYKEKDKKEKNKYHIISTSDPSLAKRFNLPLKVSDKNVRRIVAEYSSKIEKRLNHRKLG